MIVHYLKIAWRNLLKYRTQTAVNIVGLAVGFACFALSLVWIRYELTYDRSMPGSERTYVVYRESSMDLSGRTTSVACPLGVALRETFPEVEDAAAFYRKGASIVQDGQKFELNSIEVDSFFVDLFGLRVLQGSLGFLYTPDAVALTDDAAMKLFGTTDVLGRELTDKYKKNPQRIVAVVEGRGRHTNFPFDVLTAIGQWKDEWRVGGFTVCLRLRPGVDADDFANKLYEHNFNHGGWMDKFHVEPLSLSHSTLFRDEAQISLTYVRLFAFIGLITMLVAFFSYQSLFVTRIRIRSRELMLRKVCGSSGGGLLFMFVFEIVLLLLASGLVGMTLVELFTPRFCELSSVDGGVMPEALGYFACVAVFSVLLSACFIGYYSHRPLVSMLKAGVPSIVRVVDFRRLGILIQMVISVLVLFGLSVLFLQLYYLSRVDIGFERNGRAALDVHDKELEDKLVDGLRKQPYVKEVVENMYSLLPQNSAGSIYVKEWDGKQPDDEPLSIQCISEGEEFLRFYGIRLLEGNAKLENKDDVILNEAAVKRLGWANPVGKKMGRYTVTGVVKDFHVSAPTIPVRPMLFVGSDGPVHLGGCALIRFDESHADDLKRFCVDVAEEYTSGSSFRLVTVNEAYDKYLVSEKALLQLVGFVSIICIVISFFDVYSHVTLSCERRRKEIAIRKVNGARVGDILRLFAREYLGLLVVACVVAFPVGYVLMRRWLESYVEQTPISAWIYIVIFVGMAALIALCIGWRVWRAANENPAEVVKSE